VTVQDIDAAHQIWGKSIAALKGKTTHSKPNVVAENLVEIPREIMKLHHEVFLTADIFFVNKIAFLLSLSRKICFTQVNHLASRKLVDVFKAFQEMYSVYLRRGFRITTLHVDGEFAPLQVLVNDMPNGPRVNLASANEHVPEIERRIRVVKEWCRATRHSLPFNRIPALLVIYIVFNAVRLLNHFPTKGGISDTISPKTIMTGETLDYKKHLCLQIGQYCQVHEEDQPRNSQLPRTKGAICLGPSGNVQGGYKFMSLRSAKKITRRSWDEIPMPDTVIARVNELAKNQPEQLMFTDRHGRPIGDVKIPGVDGGTQNLDNEINEVDPDIIPHDTVDIEEDAVEIEPDRIEPDDVREPLVETVQEDDEEQAFEELPMVCEPPAQEPPNQEHEIPGVRRST
jgi:hypothetical protein